jgi:LPS sulfotransferase NodH
MRDNSPTPVSKTRINAQYLRTIMPQRTVQGVFTAKIQHAHVKRVIRAGLARELFDGSDLVFLSRRNLVDQAISYTVSLLTHDWGAKSKNDGSASFTDARLRREYIRQLRYLAYEYAEWHTIFNSLGLSYTELSTEHFVQQPAQTIRSLFELVDASVDERALTRTVESLQRYGAHEHLKQRLRDVIVPAIDHHQLLQARYVPADRLRLSLRNMFS